MHFQFLSACLAFAASSQAVSIVARNDKLVDCLRSSLSPQGSVVLPNNPEFTNDTTRVFTFDAPTFKVVSRVSNEDDVRASVKCAKKAETPFLFTGGKHGFYTGFQKLHNGLEIYTAAFDGLDVDAEANTMTVGGAVNFQYVSDALYAAKKNIPVGGYPCVGIVGATMGGGIGRLEGLYGLIIDSLLSVRIMLPDTTVVEASTESNPDLFWGIRGAGFNFGFVLNATYRVYDQAPNGQNLNADFQYPYNVSTAFYQALKDQASKLPPALCITTSLQWDATRSLTTLFVNAAYAGLEDEGRQAVAFLQKIGPILKQNLTMVPWNRYNENAFFGNNTGALTSCDLSFGRRMVLGAAFNEIDVEAHVNMTSQFNEMVTKYPQTRGSDNSMYFCGTQAVTAVPDNATAYGWRSALGHQTWGIAYGDNVTTDATIENLPEKMRASIADTAGTGGLEAYVGFSHGDEPLESIFSKKKLPRLAALKKRYDPHGFFNAYHPLPTSYP